MKCIVGLGNPGPQYDRTRHNIGFDIVDALKEACAPGEPWRGRFKALTCETRIGLPDASHRVGPAVSGPAERVLLMKPTTYMNLSGQSVGEAMRFYKLDPVEDVLVVVDDIALPCGSIRIRAKGGAGGHNGLTNIQQLLGTDAYARLRVGVDPPGAIPQVDYVLGKFSPEQRDRLEPALKLAPAACAFWAHEGSSSAMNTYNELGGPAKPKKQRPEKDADENNNGRPADAGRPDSTPAGEVSAGDQPAPTEPTSA